MTITGQSLLDVHFIGVGIKRPGTEGIVVVATSSVIKNRKTNKIIMGTNLILLSIFMFFLYDKYKLLLLIYSL
jgi:hypothetical protein